MIDGSEKACFAVTEPNTRASNTTQLKTRARGREADRYGRQYGQKVWISTAQVAHKILLLAFATTPTGSR